MPVHIVFIRLKQEDDKFEVNLDYTLISRPSMGYRVTSFLTNINKNQPSIFQRRI